MIRLFLASLLPSLLALLTLPAWALSPSDRPALHQNRPAQDDPAETVAIKGSSFDRSSVSVRAGESVQWTNADERDHAIVADKGEFKSGTIKPGKSWTRTFDKAGTFKYHCSLHPRAKGTVKVE